MKTKPKPYSFPEVTVTAKRPKQKPYSFPEVTVTAKRIQSKKTPETKSLARTINENPAVQIAKIFDPTGISSWPDVAYAISDYKQGKGSAGNVALNVLGALPVIGKLKAPIQLYKAGKTLTRSQAVAKNVVKGVGAIGDLAAKIEKLPLSAAEKITSGSKKPISGLVNKTASSILKTSEKMGAATSSSINKLTKQKPISKQFLPSQDITNTITSGLNAANLSADIKSASESMKTNIKENKYAKGGWITDVTKSIKKRGTEGVCTGAKFGSSSCPPGSRRYNLAQTFRKMAKNR